MWLCGGAPCRSRLCWGDGAGPLDAAGEVEHLVVADGGDVARGVAGEFFQDLEGGFGGGPAGEHFAATPVFGDEFEDVEIGEGLARGAMDFFGEADAALGVDHGAFFFAPASGGKVKVSEAGGFGGGVEVLDDEEVEFGQGGADGGLVDPGMGGVGGDDPEGADLAGVDGVDDLVVGEIRGGGDDGFGDVEDVGDFGAVGGIGEVVAADEAGDVGVEAGAHGVALAGDAVRAGAGSADVARHDGEVDDGLGGAGGFVALVDAHGPPEGDALAAGDGVGEFFERGGTLAGGGGDAVEGEGSEELGKVVEAGGVGVNEGAVDGSPGDEELREAVEEGEVAFGEERVMLGGAGGGFGVARVDDDDFGAVRVAHDALPHDGVGDAGIGADENEDVALFEIGVGEGRCVEAEGLFVGDVGGGHALAGVAVAMDAAHAEFVEATEQGHFLGADLAGAKEGDGFGAVVALDGFEAGTEFAEGMVPVDGAKVAGGVAQEWSGAAVGCGEGCERFPTFGARHAEVDGVFGVGGQIDRFAIAEMNV